MRGISWEVTFNTEASTPGKRATLGGCEDTAGLLSGPRVSSPESKAESLRPTFVSVKKNNTNFRSFAAEMEEKE